MVIFIYNPRTQEVKQESHQFKASLDYIARSCFRKTEQKIGKPK
jgi:hypothetical protein